MKSQGSLECRWMNEIVAVEISFGFLHCVAPLRTGRRDANVTQSQAPHALIVTWHSVLYRHTSDGQGARAPHRFASTGDISTPLPSLLPSSLPRLLYPVGRGERIGRGGDFTSIQSKKREAGKKNHNYICAYNCILMRIMIILIIL